MTLGEKLKYLRKNRSLKQKKISKLLDVAINTYSQYENNLRKPSIQMLNTLTNYYKVDSSYFLDDSLLNHIEIKSNNSKKAPLYEGPEFEKRIAKEHDDKLRLDKLAYEFRMYLYQKHSLESTVKSSFKQSKSIDELDRIEAKAYLNHTDNIWASLKNESDFWIDIIRLDSIDELIKKLSKKEK